MVISVGWGRGEDMARKGFCGVETGGATHYRRQAASQRGARGEKRRGREPKITRMRQLLATRAHSRAFTITELLIAVAIVAILVAIALPSYRESIARSRRVDAQVALGGLSAAMERYFTSQTPPTYVGATLGAGGIFANQAPIDGSRKFYTLSIEGASASAFTLVATRIAGSGQATDRCGDFTLTSTGVRGVRNSSGGATWQDCWR